MRALVLAAIAASLVGCGAPEGFPAVAGAVTADGEPIPTGTVTFHPDSTRGNTTGHQPVGVVRAGRYELFVPGGRKGAPLGWYKVVVHAVDDPQPGKPNRYLTNRVYTDPATTPVSVEVVRRSIPGQYDLSLKR